MDMVITIIILFLVYVDPRNSILKDGDTGYHIMTGRYILENLTFPKTDIYSHTVPDQLWIPFSWGTDVVFAFLDRLAGLNGVVIGSTILIIAMLYIVYKLLLQWKINFFILGLSLTLLVSLTSIHWLARPHLFTILFTALTFYILEKAKNNIRYLWSIPPIILFWTWIHPGVLSGFFLLGLYTIGKLIEYKLYRKDHDKHYLKTVFIVSVVSLAVTLLNPYGIKLHAYIIDTLTSSWIVHATREYHSPNPHATLAAFLYILTLATFLLSFLAKNKKVLDFPQLLSLLFWTHLSLFAMRNIALYAVVAIPLLALVLQEIIDQHPLTAFKKKSQQFLDMEKSLQYHFWPISLIIISVLIALNNGTVFGYNVMNNRFSQIYFPVKALQYVENNPIKGNMLNEDNWGGYIIYAHPSLKVFMDGRLDMYQQAFLDEYQKLNKGKPEWQDILEKYNVSWILFSNNTYFHNLVKASPNWEVYYQDELSTIFVKKQPKTNLKSIATTDL